LRRLDEATAAAVGGEMSDPAAVGFSCCYLIFACERVRDYDRAAQWCGRLSDYCHRWGIRPLFAICRAHYAAVLTLRGLWAEAEAELTEAVERLARTRPGQISEALVRLAELRRQQGRLEDAVELLDRAEPHLLVALGRAAVALDHGDAVSARDAAERFLRGLGEARRIDGAAGLELRARAHVALGELQLARETLDELRSIADRVGTDPVHASASVASGLLAAATGELEQARPELEDASERFARSGAPFEAARARLELAEVLSRLGRRTPASREARLALEAFQALGASLEQKRAAARLQRVGVDDAGQSAIGGGLSPREREVLRLVGDGLTNQEIAARLVLSEHTVHRHLANMFAKLGVSSRAAAVARAADRGLV
jgi:ATP/maltotriose-dependent transcriptional regulator MalT